MEWVETTGKSIEDAIGAALDQLGVDESDAEFEIVAEPKSGLFGLGRAEARVRARVRPAAPRPKDGNNRRKRRPERESSGGAHSRRPKQKSDKPAQSSRASDGATERIAKDTSEPAVLNGDASTDRPAKSRRRRKPAPKNEGASTMEDQIALADQGEVAKNFLDGMFEHLDTAITVDVTIVEDDEVINVAIEGDNLGHLIGPRGTTLHSLQELTRTVVQRKTGARNGRILVDIAQYREKRRQALERFTRQVAEEVLASGSQRVLEPMSPPDRKIVHDTANTFEGIVTTSEGEDPHRRVVIKPASA